MKLYLAAFLCVALASAQVPSIDQSLTVKSVQSAEISPDGRFVAYTVQETNWEDNEFVQQIWIAMLSTGERYQLTHGRKSNQTPKWSPDSAFIAFASERDGKKQIYRISPTGGEAVQLTAEDNGVDSFAWSPDGTTLAYTSTGPESKAKKDRKDKYGEFEVINGDYSMQHLWLVKAPSEIPADLKQLPKPEALTSGSQFSLSDFSWAPDGKRIAFEAQRDPDLSSQDTATLYVVNVGDKLVRKLLDGPGPQHHPVWSPDGKHIAFTTANGEKYYFYMNSHLAVVNAEGGAARLLAKDFDEEPRLAGWGPDGIHFGGLQKTESAVFRLNFETGKTTRINPAGQASVQGATYTPDGRMLA